MRKKARAGVCKAAQMREGRNHPFGMLGGVTARGGGELEVYRQIRNAVPILDAAIGKLVRLTGGFTVECGAPAAQKGKGRPSMLIAPENLYKKSPPLMPA